MIPQPSALVTAWYCLLGFDLLAYVALDGYDLGIGILSLFSRGEQERSLYLQAIEPVWDANETWLVLFGGMLFGAFPIGYGLLLSALYLPILLVLTGLIFRAVSFGFRAHSRDGRGWGLAFGLGSLAATLGQGFFLGGFLSGLQVEGTLFAGSVWAWLNPLAALVAAGVMAGYLLLGSGYLALKTRGEVQARAFRSGRVAAVAVAVISIGAVAWPAARFVHLTRAWLAWPGALVTSIPLAAAVVCLALGFRGFLLRRERAPIVAGLLTFAFAFIALIFSLYPWLVPGTITIQDAAAPANTLVAMLIGAGALLPLVVAYNIWQHWVFRGKAEEGHDGP